MNTVKNFVKKNSCTLDPVISVIDSNSQEWDLREWTDQSAILEKDYYDGSYRSAGKRHIKVVSIDELNRYQVSFTF